MKSVLRAIFLPFTYISRKYIMRVAFSGKNFSKNFPGTKKPPESTGAILTSRRSVSRIPANGLLTDTIINFFKANVNTITKKIMRFFL